MWPENSPADARDAFRPTGAVDFACVWSAMWPEKKPAVAHDAFRPPRQICTITGAVNFAGWDFMDTYLWLSETWVRPSKP